MDCREATCSRAEALCARLVECDAVLVGGAPLADARARGDLSKASARLVRDLGRQQRADASAAALSASRWWGSAALPVPADAAAGGRKARTYVVVSYGGCGSKMLAGWLSGLGAGHVGRVFHFHDKRPPDDLRRIPDAPRKPSAQRDYRARRFPGGGRFKTDTPVVRGAGLDDYRVLYIFKDPVEAMVSRFGHGHCKHLDGDCGEERAFPKLDAYAARGVDRMGLLKFFEAYSAPDGDRGFPIVLLNYHKLWNNLDAVMDALGLPRALGASFPERTETVRNDRTAAGEGNAAHSEKTRRGLEAIYAPILAKIVDMPAVSVA